MVKAFALLAVGAYAVQDTTPPVISLSFADEQESESSATATTTTTTHLASSPSVARECPVFSTETECPDPTCKAKDHHDTTVTCQTTVECVNNENEAVTDQSAYATLETANRNIRSTWLYKYDAEDLSGNTAEQVTFTLTIYDYVKPTITKPAFLSSNTEYESCAEAGDAATVFADGFSGDTNACWKTVGQASATDNVDGTISSAIQYYWTHDAPITDTIDSTFVAANFKPYFADEENSELNTFSTIDTHNLGTYHFAWYVCDQAQAFGLNDKSNCFSTKHDLAIEDTSDPILELNNADYASGNFECGVDQYVEPSATCKDLHDSWTGSKSANTWDHTKNDDRVVDSEATFAPLADGKTTVITEGTHTITYNCKDLQNNDATPITRSVTVVDTKAPTLVITGDEEVENSAGEAIGNADFEHDNEHLTHAGLFDADTMRDGFTCTDLCTPDDQIVRESTLYYGDDCGATGTKVGNGDVSNFPEYTAGAYSVKYSCTDKSSSEHVTTDCRIIQNVDHTKPIIQILGSDHMILEATHSGNYIDDGATCSDQVDGVISQNVEVSGDVVNLSKVGTYHITYNCKDSAGNDAPTLTRKVTVKQTSCPTCEITGEEDIVHEASFPYTDEGAACTDVIDGKIEPVVTITNDGATVSAVNIDMTGVYQVTYRAQNSVGLWNDGKNADGTANAETSCRGTTVSYVRKVEVKDTLSPVIQLTEQQGEEEKVIAWGQDSGVSLSTSVQTKDKTNRHESAAVSPSTLPRKIVAQSPFMAEQATASSVNGWVIGAVASAVTGLALLGYSQRKTTVATSVPV